MSANDFFLNGVTNPYGLINNGSHRRRNGASELNFDYNVSRYWSN